MSSKRLGDMRAFFRPRSLAVAGVSGDPDKLGSIIFANLLANKKKGVLKAHVYALNPSRERIGDQPCFPSITSLPEVPELLIVAVPVSSTLGIVREATKAGVKAMILVTSGFSEAGRGDLQRKIRTLAKKSGTRVLGPNTIGLVDTETGVDSLFLRQAKILPDGSEIVSSLKPLKGNVTIVTQSGYLGQMVSEELASNGVGIRALVGTGNQLDVSAEDVIQWFADDPHTHVIAAYLEGVSDGRGFMRAAAAASRRKPVVVFKVGKTDVGGKAALTHTASLVGDYEVYRAAFRQSGVVEATELQELVDLSIGFSLLPQSSSRKLAIITNAGGVGAIATDYAESLGLQVLPLSPGAKRNLEVGFAKASFATTVSLSNPLDLTASATTDEFVGVTKLALSLADFGMCLVLPTHQTPAIDISLAEKLSRVALDSGKPVAMCVMGRTELAARIHQDFVANGIPAFPSPERAIRALAALPAYNELKSGARVPITIKARHSGKAVESGVRPIARSLVSRILQSHGIREPDSVLIRSTRDLRRASRVKFPVACKLISEGLPHKTDAGGVILDVRDERALASAYEKFSAVAGLRKIPFQGMLVQEMAGKGVEIILGTTWDRTFGPTVLLGAGGGLVEMKQEYGLAIAPVSPGQVRNLMITPRFEKILNGYRGSPPVDVDKLCRVVSRFSEILAEEPWVSQLEINPLIVAGSCMTAVDARGAAAVGRT